MPNCNDEEISIYVVGEFKEKKLFPYSNSILTQLCLYLGGHSYVETRRRKIDPKKNLTANCV